MPTKIKNTVGQYRATPKMRRYALELAKNPKLSKYQAMIKAGYSKNTAVQPGFNVENRRAFSSVLKALDKVGLTDEYLSSKIAEGIDKPIKMIGSQDTVVPDYQVRSRYVEMATKMRDMYPNDKLDVNVNEDVTFRVELQGKDELPIIDVDSN